jgi:hypothetical protein
MNSLESVDAVQVPALRLLVSPGCCCGLSTDIGAEALVIGSDGSV